MGNDRIRKKRKKHLAGQTYGADHHRARYTAGEVEQVRRLREDEGMSYGQVARKMDMPKSTVRDIARYLTRIRG